MSRRPWVLALWLLLPALTAWRWPGEFNALADRAAEAFGDGRYEQAARDWATVLRDQPRNPDLAYNVGTALLEQGALAPAAEAFGRAAQIAAAPAALNRIQYNRGNAFFQLGRLKEAAEAYREALRHDPQDSDAAYNLRLCEQPQQQEPSGAGQQPPAAGQQPPPSQPDASGGQQPGAAVLPPGAGPAPQQMDEDQVDRVLQRLAAEEKTKRSRFSPRPDLPRSNDPLAPDQSLDPLAQQLSGDTATVDW
ncbi:MAG: tetratricopeptide repeat protein [Fimbriimonadaceae bacterium]|nr:tetratricopeptide repeat protein [Fimbriimonadaceae bacterium]